MRKVICALIFTAGLALLCGCSLSGLSLKVDEANTGGTSADEIKEVPSVLSPVNN